MFPFLSRDDSPTQRSFRAAHWCALGLILLSLHKVARAQAAADLRRAEQAALAADWKGVSDALGGADAVPPKDPAARLLLGQAALALNDNNRATELLLSLETERDLGVLRAWSAQLAADHADSPVAGYLKADVLARAGLPAEAVAEYDRCLARLPELPLALLGRGLALEQIGQWKSAEKDLAKACALPHPLAEAYLDMGNLQLLHNAPDGAATSFTKALDITGDFSLASNGRGVARYGLGKWSLAAADFQQALKQQPLVLYLGNIRALARAAENLGSGEPDDSPRFRYADFVAFDELARKTSVANDIFRQFLGAPVTGDLNDNLLTRLNTALFGVGFYDAVKGQLDTARIPKKVRLVIDATAQARGAKFADLSASEKDGIQRLNRYILEMTYPDLILPCDQRDPGMQLTLMHGLVDQPAYKKSLTPSQIAGGQWNMDHIGRPLADALEHSGVPLAEIAGAQFNRHLDESTLTNRAAFFDKTHTDLDLVRPGGVSMDLRQAFVDSVPWPVLNWSGFLNTQPMSAADLPRCKDEETKP